MANFVEPIDFVVWFYGQRGDAENLIKQANNDAGPAANPSGRFDVNSNHFQLAMLAYNLNCCLMLFNREQSGRDTTKARAAPRKPVSRTRKDKPFPEHLPASEHRSSTKKLR